MATAAAAASGLRIHVVNFGIQTWPKVWMENSSCRIGLSASFLRGREFKVLCFSSLSCACPNSMLDSRYQLGFGDQTLAAAGWDRGKLEKTPNSFKPEFGNGESGLRLCRANQQDFGFRLHGLTDQAGIETKFARAPRICILGGGFGGLYTALRLESLIWAPDRRPQILLIDQYDRFVFKPLLYEILSKEVDQWEIAPTFSELLANTKVSFMKDSVKAVTPSCQSRENGSLVSSRETTGGTVLLESGIRVDYDWLVLALGSESRLDFVPGAAENALPFVTLEDALEVDRRLTGLERAWSGLEDNLIQVVIVGSGYSGVELAATLAERLGKKGKVRVVDAGSDICANASTGNREAAKKVLLARNVELVLGYIVTGVKSSIETGRSFEDNGSASTSGSSKYMINMKLATSRRRGDNTQLEADLVLWTVGTKATVPSRDLDMDYPALPVNGRGQADTDEYLRVKGHPRIFALGDSAGTKDSAGRILPSTAQVAFQQADYGGWNLWAAINDRPLLPFRYQHLGEMMTLGKTDGAVSAGFFDFTLDGIVGHSARKLAYLYRLPTDEHKAKVALSWLAKSAMDTVAFFQNEVAKGLSPK